MRISIVALGFLMTVMNGCDAVYFKSESSGQALQSQSKKVLRVLTLKNPLVYQKNHDGKYSGIDYDLLQNFAEFSGIKFIFSVRPDEASLMASLARGEGDLAVGRLRGEIRTRQGYILGPAYEETHLSLFCRNNLKIFHIKDLHKKSVGLLEKDNDLLIENRLKLLVPEISLQKIVNLNAHQLFKMTAQGILDCAFAEDLEGRFFSRIYPNLVKVRSVINNYSLNWILQPEHSDLQISMDQWFQRATRQDEIMRIHTRYQSFFDALKVHDIKTFIKSIQNKLPEYEYTFKEAGRFYKTDWRLLGAIAFQESHWMPGAQSFTGVRGLMQLTEDTAKMAGIRDRTDPTESIWGGAFYFKYLWNRLPKTVHHNDRLALALAAYNIGYGHLLDAQNLVLEKGRNPYSWRDIKAVLPRLADPDEAKNLKYGLARGFETIDFVERVRGYHNVWKYLDTP